MSFILLASAPKTDICELPGCCVSSDSVVEGLQQIQEGSTLAYHISTARESQDRFNFKFIMRQINNLKRSNCCDQGLVEAMCVCVCFLPARIFLLFKNLKTEGVKRAH